MTDQASRARAKSRAADRNAIIIGAAVVLVGAIAAYLLFAGRSAGSSTLNAITGDVKGQLQSHDVSCHKIGFSVPSLTKQQIYACDAKNVTLYNRPRGHIKESAFTRCYIQSVGGQTVDVSHAISIEAKIRGKSVPCR
jgi:type IV secretory pathway protease TraF